MKVVKVIIGIAVVVLPLVWFVESAGLTFRQNGGSWLPFALAPVQALIVAYLTSGLPGKRLAGKDDQGNWFVGRFWGVSAVVFVFQIVSAIILKLEA